MSLICAIGDIHGSLRKLRELIARCSRYADGRPMTLVLLGDYIDRGPESAGVIRYVIDLQSRPPERVIALKGNHEGMALGVIDGTTPAEYWTAQGGAATLRSYGAESTRELPGAHVDWLRSLPLSYDDGRRFLSMRELIRKSRLIRSASRTCSGSGNRSYQTDAIMGA
jgi:serine/threonine protein phosphatase 1